MKCNAVFEGGGVKAIAIVGAVKAAEEKGIRFESVAGTSSGSIIASFLAAGYDADEIRQMIIDTPFTMFTKKTVIHKTTFGPIARMIIKKGLYSGNELEDWVRRILLQKGIRTFSDLRPNQLRIIASNITDGKLMVLPNDIAQLGVDPGKLEVARAIRMSCSIPYYFDPVVIRKPAALSTGEGKKKRKFASQVTYIVDGGILSNFPLWLFDEEQQQSKMIPTIGFQIVGRKDAKTKEIHGPISMFQALFSTMMDAHDERYIETHNRFRTVKVPSLGVRATQFDLSKEESLELFEAGYLAGRKFFQHWSYSGYLDAYSKYVLGNGEKVQILKA